LREEKGKEPSGKKERVGRKGQREKEKKKARPPQTPPLLEGKNNLLIMEGEGGRKSILTLR